MNDDTQVGFLAGELNAAYGLVERLERELADARRTVAAILTAKGGHVAVPDRVLVELRDSDRIQRTYDPVWGVTHYEVVAR